MSGAFPCLRVLLRPPPAGRAAWRVQAFCRRQNLGSGRPARLAGWGGFIAAQSNERRKIASGIPARQAERRTLGGSVLPEENFAGEIAREIAKQLGKQTADWLRAPDTECPALFHACAFSCARLRRGRGHGAQAFCRRRVQFRPNRFAGDRKAACRLGGCPAFRPNGAPNRMKSGHPARQAGWGGTSPGRSPSSWASKPQIGFERRTLSVRRFSVTAGSVWCRGIVLDAGDVLY